MNEFISLKATVHVGNKTVSEVYKKIEAAYDRDLEVSPHSYTRLLLRTHLLNLL